MNMYDVTHNIATFWHLVRFILQKVCIRKISTTKGDYAAIAQGMLLVSLNPFRAGAFTDASRRWAGMGGFSSRCYLPNYWTFSGSENGIW